ncbi:hypothetical protein ABES38_11625 [Bacillus gobiensis]|uniref:hypothetical protein n=1 Tax=Bacillus gobiensis TaxID=1441095 RepID=UPI003D20F8C3
MCELCNGEKKIIEQLSFGVRFIPCPNCSTETDLQPIIDQLKAKIDEIDAARKESA